MGNHVSVSNGRQDQAKKDEHDYEYEQQAAAAHNWTDMDEFAGDEYAASSSSSSSSSVLSSAQRCASDVLHLTTPTCPYVIDSMRP